MRRRPEKKQSSSAMNGGNDRTTVGSSYREFNTPSKVSNRTKISLNNNLPAVNS
jgi:hypothetical protein